MAAEPMLRLGSYTFSLDTAAYQEFQRSTEFMWAAQSRVGQDDALQSTGTGPDTIRLSGLVFPLFHGGTGQLKALRTLAGQQVPQTLIDGRGRIMGQWVITSVEERGDNFAAQGVALRQEFSLSLRRFQAAKKAKAGDISQVSPGALPVASLINNVQSVAFTAEKGPAGMLDSLKGSLSKLTGMASSLGGQAGAVLGAVRSGMNAAKTLQNAGKDANKLLSTAKNIANIPSAMAGLADVGGRVSRAAGVSAGLLSKAGVELSAGGATGEALQAVRDAMITTNQLNVLAVKVNSAAQAIQGKA